MFYKTCTQCNNTMFRKKKSEASRKNWLFCSSKCHVIFNNKKRVLKLCKKTEKNCIYCNKTFYVTQHVRQIRRKFCSRTCGSKNAANCIHNTPDNIKGIWRKNSSIRSKKLFSGRKLTEEMRKSMSERNKGQKSHFWKGGKSLTSKKIRSSLDYRIWRENIFKRDNWTCQICKIRGGVELNADHIKSFSQFPELRFELSNGRTLCRPCHLKTDNFGSKAKK